MQLMMIIKVYNSIIFSADSNAQAFQSLVDSVYVFYHISAGNIHSESDSNRIVSTALVLTVHPYLHMAKQLLSQNPYIRPIQLYCFAQ